MSARRAARHSRATVNSRGTFGCTRATSPTRATHAARPSRHPAHSRGTFGCTPATSPTRATHAARPSRSPAHSRGTFGCTPATSPTRATHAARLFPVHLVSKSTCASIADRTHTYGIKSICRVLLARHAFPIFRLARSGRGSASGRWCRRFFRQESAQVLWHHVAVLWQMSMNIRFLSLSECVQA